METISHEGKVFTKATVLAKKYRYTTDYIGQLCRAGKVESQLIGRAWFVTEESLNELKSKRYSSTRTPEIIINESVYSVKNPVKFVPRSITPVLSKTTHRSLLTEQHVEIHHEKNATTKIATYHQDLEVLEPIARAKEPQFKESKNGSKVEIKSEAPKNIPIILGEKAKHTLIFEPLPEVSLQGNLAIESLDDPDLYTDTKPVLAGEFNFTPESITKSNEIPKKLPVKLSNTRSVPIKNRPKSLTAPVVSSGLTVIPKNFITLKKVPNETPVTKVSFLAVPVCVAAAIFICVGLLSLSSFVESDGIEFRESLKFNLASVSDAVEKLPGSY